MTDQPGSATLNQIDPAHPPLHLCLSGLTGRLPLRYLPLLLIVLVHLALSLAYASLIPLGEAPDEPAQLEYARFIATNGRLPATLSERQAAGYRAVWPPLYHFLVAAPVAAVGDAAPTRLKSVGDTARRLIPTNGQTIAAFIHTADEAWPWRGISLSWRLGRLISVALTTLAVIVTYAIAHRLAGRRDLALSAAALQATLPQFLFSGSVINDDNLLILLSGLLLLTLVIYSRRTTPLRPRHTFLLGVLLGLATVAKYNALPLWPLTLIWTGWLLLRPSKPTAPHTNPQSPASPTSNPLSPLSSLLWPLSSFLIGAALTGGWWFLFIMLNFNRVGSLGLIRGSLAAVSAGAADASLRQVTGGGGPVASPPLSAWLEWFVALFQSFWGRFGGGSTIEFPAWVYGLLAVVCLVAAVGLIAKIWRMEDGEWRIEDGREADGQGQRMEDRGWKMEDGKETEGREQEADGKRREGEDGGSRMEDGGWKREDGKEAGSRKRGEEQQGGASKAAVILLLLAPLFFLPLPMLRFVLTGGNIVETAQGRHLFPALPAIALGLVWGLGWVNEQLGISNYQLFGGPVRAIAKQGANRPGRINATLEMGKSGGLIRFTVYVLRFTLHPSALILFTFILTLYSLVLIRASYPPSIPLWTTAGAVTVENRVQAHLADGVTLIGYELQPVQAGVIPVTLVWQAGAIPSRDYLIELTLTDPDGRPLGGWIGHPIGGRYPTRAWDKGDILRDDVPLPLLPNLSKTEALLTLALLDSSNQPTGDPITLSRNLSLPPAPGPPAPRPPGQLRADGLPPEAPFRYRSTLSFRLPGGVTDPSLTGPAGRTFPAARLLSGPGGTIAHFIVEADWPSGGYQLAAGQAPFTVRVSNRTRRFERPPMERALDANFADHLTLLGYDLPQRRVQPGQSFPVTLYWRAEQTIGQNLTIFNHLLDQTATQRGGADRIPLKYYTTLLWVPGEIVADAYRVPVQPVTPPGVYWLDVGLYPSDRPNFSLPLFVDGRPIDRNSVRLGPIKVGGPPPGITTPAAQPRQEIGKTFGRQITLLGFNLTGSNGQPIHHSPFTIHHSPLLTLFWQAESPPPTDYTVFVHVLDAQGRLAGQFDSPPAAGAYPTSLWEPGEIIVDERAIGGLDPGRYTLQAGLYRTDTGERLPVAGVPDGAVQLMEFEVIEP